MVWLNKMTIYYKDTGLSLETKERMTPDLKGKLDLDAIKAPSLSMLLSAPFILTSPWTPMFFFSVGKMETMVTNISRVCMPLFGHLRRDSTNSVPNS